MHIKSVGSKHLGKEGKSKCGFSCNNKASLSPFTSLGQNWNNKLSFMSRSLRLFKKKIFHLTSFNPWTFWRNLNINMVPFHSTQILTNLKSEIVSLLPNCRCNFVPPCLLEHYYLQLCQQTPDFAPRVMVQAKQSSVATWNISVTRDYRSLAFPEKTLATANCAWCHWIFSTKIAPQLRPHYLSFWFCSKFEFWVLSQFNF